MSRNENNRPGSSFSNPIQPASARIRPESRAPRFRRLTRRALALFFWGGLITYFVANLTTSWMLNRELNSIRQRGEPLRLIELAPAPIPESENAALVYQRAADALQLTKAEEELLRSNKGGDVDAALLAKNRRAMELTRQAAEMHACRFPIDYEATNLAGILLPHLGKLRNMAFLIRAEAIREAHAGQKEAALNDVSILFRMSEHIVPEPILISGLVGMAIESIGYKTLAQVLDNVALTPEEAHAFAQRLPHTDWTAAIHHDLQGERCFGMWAFQFVSSPIEAVQLSNGSPSPNLITRAVGVIWAPLWKLDEIQYLRAHDLQDAIIPAPGVPMASDEALVRTLPWYAVCTRVMLPTLSRIGPKRDEILVYREMAQIALALNAHRTTHGAYPARLEEAELVWGASLPSDLFGGQRFAYRNQGAQYLLYSIGPNHYDDDGKNFKSNSVQISDDLVWWADPSDRWTDPSDTVKR